MRYVIGCLAGLLASSAFADEFTVQSEVSKALVTPQGGIISRAVPVDMPIGTHEITVLGMPDVHTATAGGIDFPEGSGLTLIARSNVAAIAQDPIYTETAEYKALKSAVDTAQAALHAHQKLETAQQAIVEAANVRLTFVKQFASGGSSVLSLEQLNDPNLISNLTAQLGDQAAKAVSDSQEANRKMSALRDRGAELRDALDRRVQRLNAIKPVDRPKRVLKLTVNASTPFNGEITLRYLDQVYWAMRSDVHLTQDKDKGALTIAQKAVVNQMTGEDWEDVKVTLSTVDLSRAAGMNLPYALIRRLVDPQKSPSKRVSSVLYDASDAEMLSSRAAPAEIAFEGAPAIGNVQLSAGQTQIFEINAPLDIQADNDEVVVPLKEIEMDVDLYARASNAAPSGFLYADITNETGGRILPSRASLYRDGQFFGEIDMPEIVAGDEYPLQLGVLDGLLVDYAVIKREDGDRGLLSSSQIAESRFKTTVTSLLDYDIPVRMYDRLPVSESEDLIVKEYAKPSISEREIEGRRGVVSWNWDMAAGASQTIEFGYDLSWPSGFVVE